MEYINPTARLLRVSPFYFEEHQVNDSSFVIVTEEGTLYVYDNELKKFSENCQYSVVSNGVLRKSLSGRFEFSDNIILEEYSSLLTFTESLDKHLMLEELNK